MESTINLPVDPAQSAASRPARHSRDPIAYPPVCRQIGQNAK
jgi:hypothetical protein